MGRGASTSQWWCCNRRGKIEQDLDLECLWHLMRKELFLLVHNTLFFWQHWNLSDSTISIVFFEREVSSLISLFSLTSIILSQIEMIVISFQSKKVEIGSFWILELFLLSNFEILPPSSKFGFCFLPSWQTDKFRVWNSKQMRPTWSDCDFAEFEF